MSIPEEPGLYEADAYPMADGYSGYMLSADGDWYEVGQDDVRLFQVSRKDIEAIAPMYPLTKAGT